jgi:hypothetical protein
MKRIASLLLFLLAAPCLYPTFAQDTASATSRSTEEATSVMDQYFAALVNGDVATLKTMLGGDLLEKRNSLLGNPDYSGYLADTYMNATFKMLNADSTDPNTVRIDALIIFSPDESIRKRYLLRKSPSGGGSAAYRIISEISSAGAF